MSVFNALRRHPGKFIALLVAGFLCVALAEAIAYARGTAHRAMCNSNLKQIGLALHNYHDTYNCFPPAVTYGPDGKPWHSWRVLIFPFVEASPFWSEYKLDEPWNGPHNSKLTTMFIGGMPSVYRCPTDGESGSPNTSYVAIIGENTVWPSDGVSSMRDVVGGTSSTLLVVEVSDSGVHWMEPRDLRFDAMSSKLDPVKEVGIRSHHGSGSVLSRNDSVGANVLFVDGWATFLTAETSPETVRSLLDINDGKPAPSEAEAE